MSHPLSADRHLRRNSLRRRVDPVATVTRSALDGYSAAQRQSRGRHTRLNQRSNKTLLKRIITIMRRNKTTDMPHEYCSAMDFVRWRTELNNTFCTFAASFAARRMSDGCRSANHSACNKRVQLKIARSRLNKEVLYTIKFIIYTKAIPILVQL